MAAPRDRSPCRQSIGSGCCTAVPPVRDSVVSLRSVTKDYRGLRPLRVDRLELAEAQSVALMGFDQATAEVLVSLITGAITPDAGEVTVFGQSTRDIADAEAWLRGLDRFGILSERAVLLDQLTAEQNLAVPFSLDLEDMDLALKSRVRRIADEVGLDPVDLARGAEIGRAHV